MVVWWSDLLLVDNVGSLFSFGRIDALVDRGV